MLIKLFLRININDCAKSYLCRNNYYICDICGCVATFVDSSNKGKHKDTIEFTFSNEIQNKLSWPESRELFKSLRETSRNPKCDFIKKMNANIIETKNKIRLIKAILEGKLDIVSKSKAEINKQLIQINITAYDPSNLRTKEISLDNMKILEGSIPLKYHDIEVIKALKIEFLSQKNIHMCMYILNLYVLINLILGGKNIKR